MYKYCLILLLAITSHSASSSFQLDWTDGPGVPGPEQSWLDSFYQSSNIQWWAYNTGTNNPQLELEHYYKTIVDSGSTPFETLTSEDVNGDSHNDLIAGSGNSDTVCWWSNELGDGTSWEAHTVTSEVDGAFCVESADINGDGYMDIVTTARHDDEIAWWENTDGTGTQWIKHAVTGSFDGADEVVLCDIDGDNDMDIVASAIISTDILWFENGDSQGTSWVQHTVSQTGAVVRAIDAADVDGDGDEDLLVFYGSMNLVWWENVNGTGQNWTERIVCDIRSGVTDIAVADMNGDSYLDVVSAKESEVWCHFNSNGSGLVWSTTIVPYTLYGASRVKLYDHDDDGDMDIAALSTNGQLVKLWENLDGTGTDWHRFCIEGQFEGLSHISVQDLDGDGILDVAATGSEEPVAWWREGDYKSSGWLESTIEINSGDISYTTLNAGLDIPAGTSVQIQLRTSNNAGDMGDWSSPLPVPCDISGMFPETRYLQYLVTLSTTDPGATPTMNSISVNYDELGIEGGGGTGLQLIGPVVNPSSGTPSATFHAPEEVLAQFTLFDLSGRAAARVAPRDYPPGIHCIRLPEVPPGAYLLQMRAGELTELCRMVIVP